VTSRIWKVLREDGSPAVVKDLKPIGMVEELRGVHLLKWRRGVGAVRLLGVDRGRMLLEWAGDRSLVDELNECGDRAATETAAEVTARLLSPLTRPFPDDLRPLRDYFAVLFQKAKADRNADEHSPYVDAAMLADRLLSDTPQRCPLHGDLHHENVMQAQRGWLAIDPKGLVGDPAFDAANFFYNPLDRDDLCLAPDRIAFMAETFARVLGLDVRRILDQAVAYGCLSASWHDEDGNSADANRELAIAAEIGRMRKLM
jgi:streptomycin 6-kinase